MSERRPKIDIPDEYRPFLEWLAQFPEPRILNALRVLDEQEPGEGWGECADAMERNIAEH